MRVEILKTEETKRTKKTKKGYTLHAINVLDGSGSMEGEKFRNAVKGITADFESAITSAKKEGITLTLSHYQFSHTLDFNYPGNFTKNNPDGFVMPTINIINRGTRLYGTIADVINYFITNKAPEDRVLLNIFTDGQENSTEYTSPYKNPRTLAELIQNAEKNHNFTITFMGTKQDVNYITRTINIDASNTLAHNNTAT